MSLVGVFQPQHCRRCVGRCLVAGTAGAAELEARVLDKVELKSCYSEGSYTCHRGHRGAHVLQLHLQIMASLYTRKQPYIHVLLGQSLGAGFQTLAFPRAPPLALSTGR